MKERPTSAHSLHLILRNHSLLTLHESVLLKVQPDRSIHVSLHKKKSKEDCQVSKHLFSFSFFVLFFNFLNFFRLSFFLDFLSCFPTSSALFYSQLTFFYFLIYSTASFYNSYFPAFYIFNNNLIFLLF